MNRLALPLAVAVIVIAGCASGDADDTFVACTDLEPAKPLDCGTRPDLCNRPLASKMVTSPPDRAFDIVFLPEAYREGDLDDFRQHVDALIDGVIHDEHGIVAMAPELFNFHRVDIASQSDDLLDLDRHDTALAGCFEDDPLHFSKTPFLRVDDDTALFAARTAVRRVSVVIVVLNTSKGRGNAVYADGWRNGVVRLNRDDDDRVLTHELGHALVGLDDEYADADACWVPPAVGDCTGDVALIDRPNVTTDPSGAKWSALVSGAVPGGERYGACIFHPTTDCRMNHVHADDFCPVCKNEIKDMFAARLGTGGGPPKCEIELSQRRDLVSGHLFVTAHAFSRRAPVTMTFTVGGAEVAASESSYWHAMVGVPIMPSALPATIGVRCTDALGRSSTASIDARTTCTEAEAAACPALDCRCANGFDQRLFAPCEDHVCKSDREACEASCRGAVASIRHMVSALGTPECDALCAKLATCGAQNSCASIDDWCVGDGVACVEQERAILRCWSESSLTCGDDGFAYVRDDAASCDAVANACE
jgi:hypothetical protein